MSSPSGSTLAPGAGDDGPVDNATPQGDNSFMEVEDAVRSALQSANSGDSSAPGDIPSKDVSADASVSATLGEEAKTTEPKVVCSHKRSNSAGSSASADLNVMCCTNQQQSYNRFAPPGSVKGQEFSNLVKSSARAKSLATAASSEDQPPSEETPGNSFSCESLLNEIRTASSNELSYNKELFDQRFNRAHHLCFQLLNTSRSSVANLETLNRLNELIHACVSYSDFFRNQLGNVPDSNNNMSLLDKHIRKVCQGFLPPPRPSPSLKTCRLE